MVSKRLWLYCVTLWSSFWTGKPGNEDPNVTHMLTYPSMEHTNYFHYIQIMDYFTFGMKFFIQINHFFNHTKQKTWFSEHSDKGGLILEGIFILVQPSEKVPPIKIWVWKNPVFYWLSLLVIYWWRDLGSKVKISPSQIFPPLHQNRFISTCLNKLSSSDKEVAILNSAIQYYELGLQIATLHKKCLPQWPF